MGRVHIDRSTGVQEEALSAGATALPWPRLCAALLGGVCGLLLGGPAVAQAQTPCGQEGFAATVVSVIGTVTVSARGSAARAVAPGAALCYGDRIVTGGDGTIEFRLERADTTTGASGNTEILLPPSPQSAFDLTMESGLLRFISSVRGYFEIRTPLVTAGIDGTEAMVVIDGPDDDTLVLVHEGEVTATDRRAASARLEVQDGEAAYANATTILAAATPATVPDKFLPFVLRPRDAVDWAVYYPSQGLAAGSGSAAVREAARRLAAGDPDGADALLAGLAPAGPADRAAALAIRSVAAVYRNRTGEGLALAEAAVAADPQAGAAHLALSYALQAQGRVEEARAAAAAAVAVAPGDANAWARLAELDLTLGDYAGTRHALERALAAGETALARAVEGFLELAGVRLDRAAAAFDRAIALDSAAPLPRLGRGLTKVRAGRLAAGRAEIEAAVALDPRRASLRTWLGRVYFEERRPEKAAAQFRLAEEEDPDDPTPLYFSALERFAANDPVGALADVERAQALGERRGTQRGAAGLAEDRAARGAALGRIYDTLGFQSLARLVGAQAVEDDPTSPEAHFFLSDAFLGRQGFEVAQSSERMLADIFSPPNRALPQPRLAEGRLGLLQSTGPTRATFAEFSPLVTGNGVSVGLSGGFGTQNTYGLETAVAVLQGPFSLAAGQFLSATDGTLPNNGARDEIYAVEGRAQIGPQLNLFTELRYRTSETGDRAVDFGNVTLPNERVTRDRSSARAALHYAAAPGQDLVVVGTWSDLDDVTSNCLPGEDDEWLNLEFRQPQKSLGAEARYFGRFGRTQVTAGGSIASVDLKQQSDATVRGGCGAGAPWISDTVGPPPEATTMEAQAAFAYAVSDLSERVEATVGLSFGHFERGEYATSEVDPKLGLRVRLNEGLEFRAAYAETLARPLILDQTVEPTTIAGFNQFYDDTAGTTAKLAGLGADARAGADLWLGAAATRRWIDTPLFGTDTFSGKDETTLSGYVNATLGDDWAVAFEIWKQRFQADDGDPNLPAKVDTTLVPISARWFGECGLFTSIDASWIRQSWTQEARSPSASDSGVLLGGSVGYRFPNGRGIITLSAGNLLDQRLAVGDPTFATASPQGPLYPRERTIVLGGTVVW